jgi:hypothetical protein
MSLVAAATETPCARLRYHCFFALEVRSFQTLGGKTRKTGSHLSVTVATATGHAVSGTA